MDTNQTIYNEALRAKGKIISMGVADNCISLHIADSGAGRYSVYVKVTDNNGRNIAKLRFSDHPILSPKKLVTHFQYLPLSNGYRSPDLLDVEAKLFPDRFHVEPSTSRERFTAQSESEDAIMPLDPS